MSMIDVCAVDGTRSDRPVIPTTRLLTTDRVDVPVRNARSTEQRAVRFSRHACSVIGRCAAFTTVAPRRRVTSDLTTDSQSPQAGQYPCQQASVPAQLGQP